MVSVPLCCRDLAPFDYASYLGMVLRSPKDFWSWSGLVSRTIVIVIEGGKQMREERALQAEESSRLRFLFPRLLSCEELESDPLDEDEDARAAR